MITTKIAVIRFHQDFVFDDWLYKSPSSSVVFFKDIFYTNKC